MDQSIRKKAHNFKKVKSYDALKDVWRCDDCDSEALFSKNFTQVAVNQLMILRLPCLVPEFFKKS